jgi:hypothetical protein
MVWLSAAARLKLGLRPLGAQSTGKEEYDTILGRLELDVYTR